MYKFFLGILFFVFVMLGAFVARAQDSLQFKKPQMAELMRSNGKIYVVVTVLLIILVGLFIYLFHLDRKISRLEKNNK